MNLNELRDYKNWVGQTPKLILETVRQIGGWTKVFPDGLPLWAHRIRNYFNREPIGLMLLDEAQCERYINRVEKGLRALKYHSVASEIAERFGLSDFVYKDNLGWIWYQLSPGSTIYHWGSHPKNPKAEAFWQGVKGQHNVPVFKLVAPDGTDGSRETIIYNSQKRSSIGLKRNFMYGVSGYVNRNYDEQGSYNYSETIKAGFAAHDLRDIVTHNAWSKLYINPPDRFSPLSDRIFPERANNETKPIAEQLGGTLKLINN